VLLEALLDSIIVTEQFPAEAGGIGGARTLLLRRAGVVLSQGGRYGREDDEERQCDRAHVRRASLERFLPITADETQRFRSTPFRICLDRAVIGLTNDMTGW
jgi:hypothetical protein